MSAVYCVLVVYAFSQVVIFFDLGNPFGKYFFDSRVGVFLFYPLFLPWIFLEVFSEAKIRRKILLIALVLVILCAVSLIITAELDAEVMGISLGIGIIWYGFIKLLSFFL